MEHYTGPAAAGQLFLSPTLEQLRQPQWNPTTVARLQVSYQRDNSSQLMTWLVHQVDSQRPAPPVVGRLLYLGHVDQPHRLDLLGGDVDRLDLDHVPKPGDLVRSQQPWLGSDSLWSSELGAWRPHVVLVHTAADMMACDAAIRATSDPAVTASWVAVAIHNSDSWRAGPRHLLTGRHVVLAMPRTAPGAQLSHQVWADLARAQSRSTGRLSLLDPVWLGGSCTVNEQLHHDGDLGAAVLQSALLSAVLPMGGAA